MKNSNKVSQVVKIIINQKKKKKTRRKTKKAKAQGTLQDIINFQRLQRSYSNPPNNGLNAGDVLGIVSSKMKNYSTGMIDGRPVKIEVGMTGKELEKKLLEAFADKDDDGKVTSKEVEELHDYAKNLEKAYQDLSLVRSETPFTTPAKTGSQDKLKSNILNWITTKNGKPLRDLYKSINGSVPPRILDVTMRGRLIKWLETDEESRNTLEENYLTEVGDSSFDDAGTGGGVPPPQPPLSPIEGDLGNLGGGGII
jgi:hypothetical protein